MGIKDLPGAGSKFRITGAGSLPNKLSAAAGFGALSVLNKNNQKAIVDAARKRLSIIRGGGLSESQITAALSEIKASGEKLTEARAKTIKEVLKHFSRSAAAKKEKLVEDETSVKASYGGNLTVKQVERNVARSRYDRDGNREQSYGGRYGGRARVASISANMGRPASGAGQEAKTTGVEALGVKRQITGFAQNFDKKAKPTDNPPSRMPAAGTRPIGL